MPLLDELKMRHRLQVSARLIFETGWRIGTGKEGQTMSDLGVLLDPQGQPILPGSSLKGRLRSTCESLADALGLKACFLNVTASGVKCASDVKYYSTELKQGPKGHTEAVRAGAEEHLEWIKDNTCDVCKLFGSPVRAGRIRCGDGKLEDTAAAVVQIRDGVVLDRDSHTAVHGLKYDYEVLPAGACFQVRFDLDNASGDDLALFGAALFEWVAGSSIGGFTSRGLGRFHLEDVKAAEADLTHPKQRIRYLTASDPAQRLTAVPDWPAYFTAKIDQRVEKRS